MDWQAIGAVGEIVGAVGVIVSVIYLAVQIRQNTRATNAESAREATRQVEATYARDDVLNPWLERWVNGERDVPTIVSMQKGFRIIFDAYASIWFSMRSGALDRDYLDAFCRRHMGYSLGSEAAREAWSMIKDGYPRDFVGYVESVQRGLPPPATDAAMSEFFRMWRATGIKSL